MATRRTGPIQRAVNALVAAALAAAMLSLSSPSEASVTSGPTKITGPREVDYNSYSKGLILRWTTVSAATSYVVKIRKQRTGKIASYRLSASHTQFKVLYKRFPQLRKPYAYNFKVCASSYIYGTACTSVTKVQRTGSGVSLKHPKKAASKLNGCLRKGLEGVVVTASATGIVTLASVWIPGVDAITASGAAVAAGGAGAAATAWCLVTKIGNPFSHGRDDVSAGIAAYEAQPGSGSFGGGGGGSW